MKITKRLIDKFLALAGGQTLPGSSLRGDWIEQMLTDGILITTTHGSRKSLRVSDATMFRNYLASQFAIHSLEDYRQVLWDEDIDRATQVQLAGNSKLRQHRAFSGFLVNCYTPIEALLRGNPFTIEPHEGSFTFISDWQQFVIPDNVIVVSIENSENFRQIALQRHFFETEISSDYPLLFVSRYPQQQEKDLLAWLQFIPNQYVHFGDLDLAGIAIYQNEFYRYLKERASFLVPHDFEERIAIGNQELYTKQLPIYGQTEVKDSRIAPLLSCIHRYHKGYEQEGFIAK